MTKTLVAGLLFSAAALGQQATGDIKTTGVCSPVTPGNNNVFTINCGIGQAQGKKLLDIANKILEGQSDLKDEIADLRKDISELPKGSLITTTAQSVGVLSIGQSGGITAGQVNINQKKPARHIPSEMQAQMVRLLAELPGTVEISSFIGDTEAYSVASEVLEIFTKAKWQIGAEGIVRSFMIAGKPWTGIHATVPMIGKSGDQIRIEGWRWRGLQVIEFAADALKWEFVGGPNAGDSVGNVRIEIGPQSQ